jgi:hypothetical protein
MAPVEVEPFDWADGHGDPIGKGILSRAPGVTERPLVRGYRRYGNARFGLQWCPRKMGEIIRAGPQAVSLPSLKVGIFAATDAMRSFPSGAAAPRG